MKIQMFGLTLFKFKTIKNTTQTRNTNRYNQKIYNSKKYIKNNYRFDIDFYGFVEDDRDYDPELNMDKKKRTINPMYMYDQYNAVKYIDIPTLNFKLRNSKYIQ